MQKEYYHNQTDVLAALSLENTSHSRETIYGIVSAKKDLTHVFIRFHLLLLFLIFKKSEMSSTLCLICTENRSIRYGVVRALIL